MVPVHTTFSKVLYTAINDMYVFSRKRTLIFMQKEVGMGAQRHPKIIS